MRKFKLSVKRYTDKLEKEFGFADPEMVKRYAIAKREFKSKVLGKDFNPFTNDPNCKTCGKNRKG